METPRHTSLEVEFHAAMPMQRAPLLQRLTWRLGLKLLALPLAQRFFLKKNRL
jgi:hypothetical protein